MRARLFAILSVGAAACSLDLGGLSGGADGDAGPSGESGAEAGTASDVGPGDGGGVADGGGTDGSAEGASGDYRSVVLADKPVAYWRVGESSGLTAKDEVGAHPGGYQGDVTLGVPGAIDDPNTAIALLGTNGSIQMGNVLDFVGKVPISLEAWVALDVIDTDYKRVIAKRGTEGGYSIFCQQASSGCAFELIGSGTSDVCDITMDLGTWHHLVATYDGSTSRTYRDGVQVCSHVVSVTFTTVSANLVIGAFSGGGNYFRGRLDEVAIFNSALSPARINEHYAHHK